MSTRPASTGSGSNSLRSGSRETTRFVTGADSCPIPAPGSGSRAVADAPTDSFPGDHHHLAIFISGFSGGGVPRVMMTLADAMVRRGHRVDFLVAQATGPTREALPPGVQLVDLDDWRVLPVPSRANRSWRSVTCVLAVARYLRSARPEVLLSGGNYPNFAALLGRALARVPVRLVVSHHSDLIREARGKPLVRWTVRHLYPRADRVVAVSQGIADELARAAPICADRLIAIHNPIARAEIQDRRQDPIDHPWFAPGQPPVVLGVGRLHPQKDFPTLLRAFARIRRARPARLVILGSGTRPERRDALLALAAELGVSEDVDLPGFVENPFPYMSHAAVFVLSSAWEGFGNVLVEAMACGCPVVSTDCPSGPSEILDAGRYGPLVPVGDDEQMARATLSLLASPPDPERLLARAREFSVDVATNRYLRVLFG